MHFLHKCSVYFWKLLFTLILKSCFCIIFGYVTHHHYVCSYLCFCYHSCCLNQWTWVLYTNLNWNSLQIFANLIAFRNSKLSIGWSHNTTSSTNSWQWSLSSSTVTWPESSSRSLLSKQMLCRMQQLTTTFGIRSTRLMSSIFRRLKRPFSRAKARSITQRDVDRVVLNFRCFDVRRPVSLYGTISCFMSGYAASPTMWPSFGNMLGSVLIRSKKSDLFKTVASCTDPTSPAWQSVNFRSALHTACRMMEWWPFLLT